MPGTTVIQILGADVCVVRKPQKNMYLTVRPDGTLRVTCPPRTSDREIEAFVVERADWLRRRLAQVARHSPEIQLVTGERTPLWGRLLELSVRTARPFGVSVSGETLILSAPEGSTREERAALLERFYRAQTTRAALPFLRRWQPVLGVAAAEIVVRDMSSRWGSCNVSTGRVCLNLRLARKQPRCLEYVVVHELCHLLVPDHSARFWARVAACLPDWHETRALTNAPDPADG